MKYIDRKGNVTIEETGQDKFLRHLYTDWGGRLCLKLLVRPFASGIVRAFFKTGISARLIPGFIKRNKIVMSEYEETVYRSYHDFFIRKPHAKARPIAKSERALVCPCDGKLTVARIDRQSRFYVDNTVYTVLELLRSHSIAQRYLGGYAVIIRTGM